VICLSAATVSLAAPVFAPASDSPFQTGNRTFGLAFAPTGLLATASFASGSLSIYRVGPDGALNETPGSPHSLPNATPASVAFSSTGLLATSDPAQSSVSVFTVAAGGLLAPVSGSPFATGAPSQGFDPTSSIAFSPSGNLLAITNYDNDTVQVFKVGACAVAGKLTAVAGSPFPAGTNPASLAFSPAGGLLATDNSTDGTVSMFTVGSGATGSTLGKLTPVIGQPFPTGLPPFGNDPLALGFSPGGGTLATATATAVSRCSLSEPAAPRPAASVAGWTPPRPELTSTRSTRSAGRAAAPSG
jgi:6-phosphogluconolactonase